MMVNNRTFDFAIVMIAIIVNDSDTDGSNNNDNPKTNLKSQKQHKNSFRKATLEAIYFLFSPVRDWSRFHKDIGIDLR